MDEPKRPLGLIAAVALEIEPLQQRLDDMRALSIGRKPAWSGSLAGEPVVLMGGGMGKTNAAQALTALLEAEEMRGVIAFGVGGAYPESGLQIGEVALATAEIYGDEGVDAPEGWLSTEAIGIPLLHRAGTACFNEIALDATRVSAAAEALKRVGIECVTGPFVTVSTCSGTAARGALLRRRFGAVCETMEGAAAAHVAALYGAPFLELRGISNHVEDRDLSRWALAEAAEAAARAVERVVARWED